MSSKFSLWSWALLCVIMTVVNCRRLSPAYSFIVRAIELDSKTLLSTCDEILTTFCARPNMCRWFYNWSLLNWDHLASARLILWKWKNIVGDDVKSATSSWSKSTNAEIIETQNVPARYMGRKNLMVKISLSRRWTWPINEIYYLATIVAAAVADNDDDRWCHKVSDWPAERFMELRLI